MDSLRPLIERFRAGLDGDRASVARRVTAAWVVLLALVAASRFPPIPAWLSIPAWPALAAAFLLDATLSNELGVAVGGAGFWALFVAFALAEAGAVVTVTREARSRIDC